MRTSTAKTVAAIALTGAGSALVVAFQVPSTPALAATSATTTGSVTATGATTTGTSSGAATPSAGTTSATATVTPTATSSTTTQVAVATAYADGTWTGAAVEEPWGAFQVQAVVSGGQITTITVVASPQDGHSSRINSQAVPILTQAALADQGASIDMVSGATWTSNSYITSLQAALDQAKAEAQTTG
jgi:uncharacterized protein with FMN-binding domain